MTGKSKTEFERRAMRERCEKIAAKYRDCDENTTGWVSDWVPLHTPEPVAATAEPEPMQAELERAAARRRELYGGSEPEF